MSESKTEGRLIAELEKLLDSLTDDAARRRVLEWAQQRLAPKSEPAKTAPFIPSPLGPALNPPAWQPLPTWPAPGSTVATFHNVVIGGPQRPSGNVLYRS